MSKKIKIKQVHSTIGRLENQKRVMAALGLSMGRTVTHDDSVSIRGMIDKVKHLVTVEEDNGVQ